MVAADGILESNGDRKFLCREFSIEVVSSVGFDSHDGQLQPIAVNVLIDGGNVDAKGHSFIVLGHFVRQQFRALLVDGFGNSASDDMTYSNLGLVDLL